MSQYENKTYLGDAVYAELVANGFQIKLTTSDGRRDTNTIYLEMPVYNTLVAWVESLDGKEKSQHD